MPATPTSTDLTRQQLEELDALLQRMLSGASVKSDERKTITLPKEVPLPLPPEPVVLSARVPMPVSNRDTLVDKLTERIDTSVLRREQPELPAAPLTRIPMPIPQLDWLKSPLPEPMVPITPAVAYQPPPMPAMETLQMAPHAELPPPQYGRVDPNPVFPEPMVPLAEAVVEPVQPVVDAVRPAVPVVLWPMFAVNWIAEGTMKLFGGEALLAPGAKNLLGWSGIALLLAAGLWTGYGYISPAK